MKAHTNDFKTKIKEFGRELDSIITYTIEGVDYELGMEELSSVTPHYEADILKSVMRQLDLESNTDIPIGTVINYQFGVKVRDNDEEDYRDNYDYIDYGNYIVYSSEKQEDTNSYKIICYDKMLNAMKEYESMGVVYPITIRSYISAICTHLGLTFKNANSVFANYDKEIQSELFLTEDGESLDYTFRDVLDQLAEVTASTICINEDDDELEIRYISDTNDTIDEECFKDINVNFGQKFGPVNSIVLSRADEADSVYLQDDDSVLANGLCEIKIKENQIMNFNDRSDYLQDILDELDGLEYYINDYSSTGICYYNVCDKYYVSIGSNTYGCIMLNDEVLITQGLEENVNTPLPQESVTDYKKADKTDRKINQTYIIADKANQQITSAVIDIENLNGTVAEIGTVQTQTTENFQYQITQLNNTLVENTENLQEQIDEASGIPEELRNSLITIDINGIEVATNLSKVSTLMANNKFAIQSGDTELTFIGYDENLGQSVSRMDNLTITNYFMAGMHRQQTFEINAEERTGWFYLGGS